MPPITLMKLTPVLAICLMIFSAALGVTTSTAGHPAPAAPAADCADCPPLMVEVPQQMRLRTVYDQVQVPVTRTVYELQQYTEMVPVVRTRKVAKEVTEMQTRRVARQVQECVPVAAAPVQVQTVLVAARPDKIVRVRPKLFQNFGRRGMEVTVPSDRAPLRARSVIGI